MPKKAKTLSLTCGVELAAVAAVAIKAKANKAFMTSVKYLTLLNC